MLLEKGKRALPHKREIPRKQIDHKPKEGEQSRRTVHQNLPLGNLLNQGGCDYFAPWITCVCSSKKTI